MGRIPDRRGGGNIPRNSAATTARISLSGGYFRVEDLAHRWGT